MATYKYTDSTGFNNGSNDTSTLDWLLADKFIFDGDAEDLTASSLQIEQSGLNVTVSFNFDGGQKALTLNATELAKIGSTTFTFADGGKVLIGDGTTATDKDGQNNALISTLSDDYIDGLGHGAAGDTVKYTLAISGVTVDLSNTTSAQDTGGAGVDFIKNVENIVGSKYNDKLTGDAGDNNLNGGLGNDIMTGGDGNDYYVATAGDVIVEAADEGTDTVETKTDYILGANLENLVMKSGSFNGTGNGLANTITGNTSANIIDGGLNTSGFDTMEGGSGNDTYIVNNNLDVITETSTGGTDTAFIMATAGVHTLSNNVEIVRLVGAASVDASDSEVTTATIYAGTGANTITGSGGTLSYEYGATRGVTVSLALGTVAQTTVGSGSDTITAGSFSNLTGSRFNDTLTSSANGGTVKGLAGADTLISSSADATLDGGAGNDTYNLGEFGATTLKDSGGSDTVLATSSVNLTQSGSTSIENLELTASTGTITGTGNTLANTLTANASGTANITLVGGAGNDTYFVNNTGTGAVSITEASSAGTDSVFSSVDFSLATDGANVEKLTLTGSATTGTGNDSINTITGNDLGNTLSGNGGNDTLLGGAGEDILNGGTGNDIMTGGDNNDILDGGEGSDTMTGGNGDDTYVVNVSTDKVIEAAITDANPDAGTDTVQSSISTSTGYTLPINVENLELIDSALNGYGNTLNNTLTGNGENNILDGKTGADTMIGGAGDDTYYRDNVDDVITETNNTINGVDTVYSSLTYTLVSHLENLTLTGTAANSGTGNSADNIINGNTGANALIGLGGNDTLNGNSGADTLNGGAGNDELDGGAGKDVLVGGAGNDTFVFSQVSGHLTTSITSTDVIGDFDNTTEEDLIDLSGIFGGSASFIGTNAFNGTDATGQVRVEISGADLIVQGSTDADNAAEFVIVLTGGFELTMTSGDFIF